MTSQASTVERAAPAVQPNRAYDTRVTGVQQLSPHFIRVTVTDPELQHFYTGGLDQRIKLFLPREDGTLPDVGLWQDPPAPMMEWYNTWRHLSDVERNPIRTYTVRDIRPQQQEIDIDFVVHGTEGPASAWALKAQTGDRLVIIGPDGRSDQAGNGIEWSPGTARDVLLAGDETAAPAICAIIESLPKGFSGEAYIEVPYADDALHVTTEAEVEIHWLGRDGAELGAKLKPAVEDWAQRRSQIFVQREEARTAEQSELPDVDEEAVLWEVSEPEGFREYAWLAGEAGIITSLRRHLVKEIGMSRKQVSFMGYWKKGRASS